MTSVPVLADRRNRWAFPSGCVAVTAGVLLHLPMFWMGRDSGFHLADMPMDAGMWWGMALIVVGIGVAGYGLLPRQPVAEDAQHRVQVSAPEDAPLGPAHIQLMVVLTIALVIDVMKPASLGFVVPGMTVEYGVSKALVAWLPFAALCGTVVGSVVWGLLADVYGRRASILLSAVMFVGTSICGAMPSFWWNVGMCFLMGAAAGGMLPVTYALLAETMPTRQRGWVLVLVGGLGAVGGYLAASGFSAWLEPILSWRILWFLNLPTGLALIFLNRLIPESPKFLIAQGHTREANEMLRQFGCVAREVDASDARAADVAVPRDARLAGKTWALSIAAIGWGLINFGLLLWMPATLVAKGYSMELSSRLLAASALIAVPTVFLAAFVYSRWSSKGALMTSIAITALGLAGVIHLEMAEASALGPISPVWAIALLIVGSNGVIAMLLPYAAEIYPLKIRGRATGWVAACTKSGGLIAQLLGILALAPSLLVGAWAVLVPVLLALALMARFGVETRGRDLREFDGAP
jgi:putative MFS transporter